MRNKFWIAVHLISGVIIRLAIEANLAKINKSDSVAELNFKNIQLIFGENRNGNAFFFQIPTWIYLKFIW